MTRLRVSACVLAVVLLVTPISAGVCPPSCVCSTTRDGLHRAACSDVAELFKFSIRQKHHNINILDLSHNNITKITHELDRLTEVVTLDLSTNGIKEINKFLQNAKKLVHLNLANNRIDKLSLAHLPKSVSSIDLTNNLLQDVPSDFRHLIGLEHLEMEGNPLNCSCENIMARDYLLIANVHIDNVLCFSPSKVKNHSWLELKTKDICKVSRPIDYRDLDMMMGDQPVLDAVSIGHETTELRSMPLVALNDLEDGDVLESGKGKHDDDDEIAFIKADKPTQVNEVEGSGSGDIEVTTSSEIEVRPDGMIESRMFEREGILPVGEYSTEDTIEGSGSGEGWLDLVEKETTTTQEVPTLYTGPIHPFFESDLDLKDPLSTTEYPTPKPVTIFMGGRNWIDGNTKAPAEETTTTHITRDTTVSEQIRVTQSVDLNGRASANDEKVAPHKTGTYVCIAIIIVLLVGLIGFAIVKGQMRKRRDRRLLRQQKRDVEKASKEMVDMNKSLLGKPAPIESPIEKKANGKYELVPTHEPYQNGKKGENGDIRKGVQPSESNVVKKEAPKNTNQNKRRSRENNLNDDGDVPIVKAPLHETSFDSAASVPDNKRDTHSLSSDEIFVPEDNVPHLNGVEDSDLSPPLMNGDQNTDSDFLSPSRDYVPVYSPDMGRVRIKMSETPKPTTPVLVTRSRSNAGDIIITPSLDGKVPKSTT